jgi:class 3 adenylate cyclase
VLVGRDEPLFALEDALLAAHGGETRFAALRGEAGIGKTRLVAELAGRARKLGWDVLSGSCSEAELSLPYLPLVEALGNHLARADDLAGIADELGAARRELAQLFPQLGEDDGPGFAGDPRQARLRLFESVVVLLRLIAQRRGLLLVVEDAHWADAATRELLDHLVRRLTGTRALVVLTLRSDELDRRHPLGPFLQAWRRAGLVETVTVTALGPSQVGEMIAAILDEEQVDRALADLMYERCEGNPFVLEELLKEAIDQGEVFRTDEGWQVRSLEELRLPESVRDSILLRLRRLDPAHVEVLEAAAVLGRSFDYETLVPSARSNSGDVQAALAVALEQQLLEEHRSGAPTYRWRHALTQEAVADEIVLPRRQQIHSDAAEALAAAGAPRLDVARHLLGAARFDEAVPVCIAATEEVEAQLASGDAIALIERTLPHVSEQRVRAELLCRMGRAFWNIGQPGAAERVLVEGISALEAAGDELAAARYRLVRGRSRWELLRSQEAADDFAHALDVLERHGPTEDLALAYIRIAGLHKFELDHEPALEAAERALAVAEAAGADALLAWAHSWHAIAAYDAGRTSEAEAELEDAFRESVERGYAFVALNIAYNDAWVRLHTLRGGITAKAGRLGPAGSHARVGIDMLLLARAWELRVGGELRAGLDSTREALEVYTRAGFDKFVWRARVEEAETLLELGDLDAAAAALPSPAERTELQDLVYDGSVQLRLRLATGRTSEAVALAREIAASAERLGPYRETLAVAIEALVEGGAIDEAEELTTRAAAYPTDAGEALIAEARARLALARGDAGLAVPILETVVREARTQGFRLVELRARTLLAEALAREGAAAEAEAALDAVLRESRACSAQLIASAAIGVAERFGLSVREPEQPPPEAATAAADLLHAGERLVTTFFADVRGYTGLATTAPPPELAERLTALHRWAAAETERHHGLVDKFAGDAVMATFNASGARLDHTAHALEAALALRGKAALLDLGVGIGIAVGPAVVTRSVERGNVSVLGEATNLAARLQAAAGAGEIVLSDEAHRRVREWLEERGLAAQREDLELKGFDGVRPAWRIEAA